MRILEIMLINSEIHVNIEFLHKKSIDIHNLVFAKTFSETLAIFANWQIYSTNVIMKNLITRNLNIEGIFKAL